MVLKKSWEDRNNTIGQFFTPDYVAEFMVKNVLKFIKKTKNNSQDFKVLEPSVGEGVFLQSLQNNNLRK